MTTTIKLHELNTETRARLEEQVKAGEAAKAMLKKLEEDAEPTTLTGWLTEAEGLMFHYDHFEYTAKAAPVIHIPYADFKVLLRFIHKAQDLARTAPTPSPAVEPHTDDIAVDQFAAAMKAKLARQRARGYAGWKDGCTPEYLSTELRRHVDKGDPVDVANFAMFLQQRGERITQPDAEPVGKVDCWKLVDCDGSVGLSLIEPPHRPNIIAYPLYRHPSPVSGAVAAGKVKPFGANDCLMYLIKEADLDHCPHREYIRDFNGRRYQVTIEREGKN